jgi:endonuclease I
MKKITTVLLFVLITNVTVFAQAVLPTSWNFATTTLPTGWVSSGGFTYYAGSGNPAPAAKFPASGTTLTISFTTTPGNISYDISGNNVGSAWTGNFVVEESVNGTTYTTVGTAYTNITATNAYTNHTATLNAASRYLRFNMITHTAGNIGIDNVSIGTGVSAGQQILVKQGSAPVLNGGTYTAGSPVGTPLPINFDVYNLGTTGTLNVTGATLSGPAMADYAITTTLPFSVAGLTNSPLSVTFTPSVAGTRNAVLTIANDDATNNPYIINLNGIGGTLATEPASQPTSLTFPLVKSYRIRASFAAATGSPDGYIVLRKTGSAVTDLPVDGTVYQRGDMIGTSKVVYSSSATGFMPNDIKSSTQYFFAVYAYNGTCTFRNYLTTAPLTGSVTSSGTMMPGGYYSTINTANTTLVTDLHALTNPHTLQLYGSYGPLMMEYLYQRDTTGDQRVATDIYSGENIVYSEPFDWVSNNMSREHTYCQSWQPTVNDPNFTSRPEYNDYHMITPTDQTNVNAVRSNYPLGIVAGAATYTYLGAKLGLNAAGKTVWEPRDSDKGDAARCMLYQCICYTGVAYSGNPNTNATYGGSWSLPLYISGAIPYGEDQAVLKAWSQMDLPDNFEISRNDYVDSLQGNRNPFIDHPEYICYINFDSMTYISLAPNPNNGNFIVNYTSTKNEKVSMTICDMVGRIVYSNEVKVNSGNNPVEMNIQNVSKGIYSFEFITEQGKQTQRLVIQ